MPSPTSSRGSCSGEELEAVNEYLESIEVKLGVIKAKVNGTIDWGTLTKKEG